MRFVNTTFKVGPSSPASTTLEVHVDCTAYDLAPGLHVFIEFRPHALLAAAVLGLHSHCPKTFAQKQCRHSKIRKYSADTEIFFKGKSYSFCLFSM